jgi:hypothetical protein
MSGRGEEGLATGARTKKGRNFCPEEEEQCCRSFMHTSTDSRRGIGEKNPKANNLNLEPCNSQPVAINLHLHPKLNLHPKAISLNLQN